MAILQKSRKLDSIQLLAILLELIYRFANKEIFSNLQPPLFRYEPRASVKFKLDEGDGDQSVKYNGSFR